MTVVANVGLCWLVDIWVCVLRLYWFFGLCCLLVFCVG